MRTSLSLPLLSVLFHFSISVSLSLSSCVFDTIYIYIFFFNIHWFHVCSTTPKKKVPDISKFASGKCRLEVVAEQTYQIRPSKFQSKIPMKNRLSGPTVHARPVAFWQPPCWPWDSKAQIYPKVELSGSAHGSENFAETAIAWAYHGISVHVQYRNPWPWYAGPVSQPPSSSPVHISLKGEESRRVGHMTQLISASKSNPENARKILRLACVTNNTR